MLRLLLIALHCAASVDLDGDDDTDQLQRFPTQGQPRDSTATGNCVSKKKEASASFFFIIYTFTYIII